MAKFFKSKFTLTKRYTRFSNTCVYFSANQNKAIRYGYKFYQKIFKQYKSGGSLRINVRKPRMAVKRKTAFGQALEIKEKFSYLIGGIHASKLRRYCRISKSKFFAPADSFSALLEKRLDIILYRSNLFFSPKIARWAIKSGFVKVGQKLVMDPSFKVDTDSTIDLSVPSYFYFKLYSNFKVALSKRLVFKPEVGHLTISYKLFRIVLNERPSIKAIFFPFNFNINFFYRLYSILNDKAEGGIEPPPKVLQTFAMPLCYSAVLFKIILMPAVSVER